MTTAQAPIAIVGAGQAAARAAHALRALGCQTEIVMLGAEAHAPYERPPLSKAVLLGDEEPALDVLPDPQLRDCALDFRPGVRVRALDTARQALVLEDGSTLRYGRCLLATGGAARQHPALPPGMAGVHYLRTLDDARALRAALRPGARLCIVGAGFLGLEAAASALRRDVHVTLIERAPELLGRFVPPELADWLAGRLRAQGAMLRTGRTVRAAHPGAGGLTLQLDDGTTAEADCVLVAIGLAPEVGLAQAAGLAIDAANGGIAVAPDGRSSDLHVFAAGDCASQFNPYLERHLRLESWQNANEQAQAAAAGLLGLAPPAPPFPWFWSDQGPHNLQMLGLAEPGLCYVRRGDPASMAKALWIGHRDGIPVHGIALNAGADLRALRPLFERRADFDPVAFSAPATALRPWVKATLAASTAPA